MQIEDARPLPGSTSLNGAAIYNNHDASAASAASRRIRNRLWYLRRDDQALSSLTSGDKLQPINPVNDGSGDFPWICRKLYAVDY